VTLLCDLLYIVQSMNVSSDFSADIGLRVVERGTDARVVTVVGQIDVPTARELATSLIAQLTVARVVVVNLDGVECLGSAALFALFEANEFATQHGRALRLVRNSRIANWALAASGLREYFTFTDSVPEDSACMGAVIEAGVIRRLPRSRNRRPALRDTAAVYDSVRTGPN
jgi:anti-anti-sigma factor